MLISFWYDGFYAYQFVVRWVLGLSVVGEIVLDL